MNPKGHSENLVAGRPGNLHALKSGVHSPRLIQARAEEIIQEFDGSIKLDDAGRVALKEVASITATIEAILRELDERGLTDAKGNERHLLKLRESYSRRLLDAHDRLLEAIARAGKAKAGAGADEVVGEQADYVRRLQVIGLGYDPRARPVDEFNALKTLVELGPRGTTSHFRGRGIPWPDDPDFQREAEGLHAELENARKESYLEALRNEIIQVRMP